MVVYGLGLRLRYFGSQAKSQRFKEGSFPDPFTPMKALQ